MRRYLLAVLVGAWPFLAPGQSITHDAARQVVTLADGEGSLVLRLNYAHGCFLEQAVVRGREVLAPESGACSGIKAGEWSTTRSGIPSPTVVAKKDKLIVKDIRFGGPGAPARETWTFEVKPDRILWRIDRAYAGAGTIEDTCFPGWTFKAMDTWTAGMLGNGGVIWTKYLETPKATFGTRADAVTFWNRGTRDGLRIAVVAARGGGSVAPAAVGARFSHEPDNRFSFHCVVAETDLSPKHELRRFLRNGQDVWKPFPVSPREISVQFSLQAFDYDQACGRGTFPGLREASVREILNTIGRYGVVDRGLVGGNGWRTGWVCLHEPWFAQFGLAIADPAYTRAFAQALDYERDHAITPEGRVKSRWHHTPEDAQPGTYDALGFYEAKWGLLLDSQPSYVINVVEQFDLTGDRPWLKGQKAACERALDYLLRRDADGDGLAEMEADSHTQQRGSDWIDIIWASHKNALVNAELYYALVRWAEDEELLGDAARAASFRNAAGRLKATFNRTTADGGFWDPQNQWYVYWIDKDRSVHGNNLVTPVNFAAIAYGLCDDPTRQRVVLDRIELETAREKLFFWPLSVFPYAPAEGGGGNYPFPRYENGDIFLSWGELGIRSYVRFDPALALKYVKNVLDRYEADGLSFQRYLRRSQAGSGDDILSGNCSAAVGLYRDIYGIQPRHDRLWLDPHLTPELEGTQVKYPLREQTYLVGLSTNEYHVSVNAFTVRCARPFAVRTNGKMVEYLAGPVGESGLSVTRAGDEPLELGLEAGPGDGPGTVRWTERSPQSATRVRNVVRGLQAGARYRLSLGGKAVRVLRVDAAGRAAFPARLERGMQTSFELTPE